jgi:hypothetical protein
MSSDRERVTPRSTIERATLDGREVVVLYRPTGPAEMKLLEDDGLTRWPPRLPEQRSSTR